MCEHTFGFHITKEMKIIPYCLKCTRYFNDAKIEITVKDLNV